MREHLRRRLERLEAAEDALDGLAGGDPIRQMQKHVPLGECIRIPGSPCAEVGINAFDVKIMLGRLIEATREQLGEWEVTA